MNALAKAPGLLFTDDANGIITWLDTASRLLNPSRLLHHRVTRADIQKLFQAIPPPPPSLQERWATTVWPMPNEPFTVYLVRCLAHHSSLTGLDPHMTVGASSMASDGTTHLAATPATAASALQCEVCWVVGLRIRPCHADLAQTGWDAQPCPCCRGRSDDGTSARPHTLPLRYGGEVCDRCGQAFPLAPSWTRRRFVVLQRANGVRTAAVVMGDALSAVLRLGQPVRALLYQTHTESRQPLVVVHAAEPVLTGLSDPSRLPSSLASLSGVPFEHLCRSVCPGIMGQEASKALLLLGAVHTLYRLLRAAGRPGRRWQPLHLLVVGPARCGKTALLQGVSRLYGSYAEMVTGTVIRRKRASGAATSTIEDALPSQADGLLLSGTAASSAALFVDDLESGSATAALRLKLLRQLLEGSGVCLTNAGGGAAVPAPLGDGLQLNGSGAVECEVQLVAGAQEESRLAALLVAHFPLVTRVTPRLSLSHSATIGHAAVAASLARSSLVRSASMTSVGSGGGGGRGGSQRSGGSTQDRDCCGSTSFNISAEGLLSVITSAPEPPWLESCVSTSGPFVAYYKDQLERHVGLVEATQCYQPSTLPPPASLRGTSDANRGERGMTLAQQQLMGHLGTLAALTQARVIIAGGVSSTSWEIMAAEVWSLYAHHLRSVAQQLDTAPVALHQDCSSNGLADMLVASSSCANSIHCLPDYPAEAASPSCLNAAAAAATTAAEWGCPNLARNGCTNGKRKRSKKASKLLLVDLMLREQQRFSGSTAGSEAVCSFSRAQALYLSIGGAAAVGDPFEVVMEQLQQDGLLIRRPTGWLITGL